MIQKIAIFVAALCLPAFADFSYQETSTMTGGMMGGMMKFAGAFSKQAHEPIVNFVAVKGDRLVHGSQHRASVIDLDKETITEINFDKKQYTVMTFAQMKQRVEDASERMKSMRGAQPDAAKADLHFKVSAKDTGQKKQIAGLDTHEMILTMEMEGADQQSGSKGGMVITSDMWLAPKVAGYGEVEAFYKRMAQKISWTPGGGMGMMGRPEMAQGMAEIQKEAAKLNGTPVRQTVKMGAHAEGQQGQGDASASLMEMTTEKSGFSSAPADPSKFEVPAGFQQADPETMQHRHR